ncbi:MAG: hypothetical protein ACOYJU_03080 [Anaerovoracaceae bacterium]|jgi:hypothetical protein
MENTTDILKKLDEFRVDRRSQRERRILDNMRAHIAAGGGDDIVMILDEYVAGTQGDKTLPRKLALEFYEFLGVDKEESILPAFRFMDIPLHRQLEIAKYLHEPHSVREIAQHFGVSLDTIRDDLLALMDGIRIMGSTIRINEERESGQRFYRSTMHPVFLPLNLSEVILMTAHLLEDTKDSPFEEVYRRMAGRIYGQLSPYGKSMVEERISPEDVALLREEDNRFRDEEESLKSGELERQLLYAVKIGVADAITFQDEDGRRITLEDARIGVSNREYFISDRKGKRTYSVRREQVLKVEIQDYRVK